MTAPSDSTPHRHRVLLVDDQAMIGAAVQRLVAGADDIDFEFRRTAEAALAAAEEFRPTVILQDLVMPDVEGLDMVGRFRELPATAHVPVIVLSAQEEPTIKAQLLGAGASDYLVKLPDEVELVARIRVHSEGYHRLVERNAAFAALEKSLAELREEREKSERLLLNILPAKIAARLKEGEQTIAESFAEASVLFADLSGFTSYSQHVDAQQLVGLLDTIFSAFDHVASAAGVEKIKTIGDAYMAVAGLPVPRADHAEVMSDVALGMQVAFTEAIRGRGVPLELRIGIHSGPVVAGVIGRHKFIYDLWGDTVNIASRMESHGEGGRVHVSAATRDLLVDQFRFESRGAVTIKGKGVMETYFLLGRASPAA
jgi:adenylate cyclase